MTTEREGPCDGPRSASPGNLRLWPAWLIAAVQAVALILSVTPSIQNVVRFVVMMGWPALACLLFAAWLLFGSRLRWREKGGLAAASVVFPAASAWLSVRDPALQTTLFCYGVPLAVFMLTGALTVFERRRRRAFRQIAALLSGVAPIPWS